VGHSLVHQVLRQRRLVLRLNVSRGHRSAHILGSQLHLVELATQIEVRTGPKILLGCAKVSCLVVPRHVLIFLVVDFDRLSLPHHLGRVVALHIVVDILHALAEEVLLRHHLSLRYVAHELMLRVLRFVRLEIWYRMRPHQVFVILILDLLLIGAHHYQIYY